MVSGSEVVFIINGMENKRLVFMRKGYGFGLCFRRHELTMDEFERNFDLSFVWVYIQLTNCYFDETLV